MMKQVHHSVNAAPATRHAADNPLLQQEGAQVIGCDQTVAWRALQGHYEAHGRELDLRDAFARDPGRFAALTLQAPEVFADLSKNRWDLFTRKLLIELAHECGMPARRDAMFAGKPINITEGRAVLHTALRAPRGAAPHSDEVHAVLDAMLAFAERTRDSASSGVRDVVNIGIGGSDLGPQMAVPALDAFASRDIQFHFVSNVDGHDIVPVLRRLNPESTLFIVASKTFTTQETMANANVAREWFVAQGGRDVSRHFAAVTTNLAAAAEFGIDTAFGFWDWVGGRYSMWSAIGLPIAIAIGAANFRALLAGAHTMDRHFAEAPLEHNLPAQLGLLDVWYRNFHRFTSRSVAPYHQGLRRLPAYLQQLEMESNGKGVDLDGQPLRYGTSPVVWGEPGTNGQHAFFQMLHQGTDVIPVEFIAVREASHPHTALHRKALANCLAQSQALMQGKTVAQARAEAAASATLDADTLARHRAFPGNRPSTTLVLDALTPRSLGALIALYEHRVFTSGAVWGINSFDQWGVELGKALCNELLPRLDTGATQGLDASTSGLLARLRK
jgi:glucose-6-phosphate isomerase